MECHEDIVAVSDNMHSLSCCAKEEETDFLETYGCNMVIKEPSDSYPECKYYYEIKEVNHI
jgi:hypothetical protein